MLLLRVLCLLAMVPAVPAADDSVAWPAGNGFRMENYRAPTPTNVPGGRMIDTAEAHALLGESNVVWIDVLPAPRRPEGLSPGAIWRPSPHAGIPGSIWLPEVGRGALSPALETWFRAMLLQATGNDPGRTLVFYCLGDCWMSWNAAKRAAEWGYRRVLWYRDGIDDWEAEGLPTEILQPAPGAP